MRTVLMISPGYPAEMPFFVRGLASIGARVIGVGDQPVDALPQMARDHLAAHWQIPSFADEQGIVQAVRGYARNVHIDQVESLWEPTMVLAARLRELLGVPGMTVGQTIPFRNKEEMKRVLDGAGIRTPHHHSARTASRVREAALAIGFPIIVKPIAGAGSAHTHRDDDQAELEAVLPQLAGVPEVSVEEFIDGEEFTFDTICAGGRVLYENISWYRPRPLIARSLEWISPITLALRDPGVDHLAGGRAMGHAVVDALGFQDGFTHMEWYRKPGGEVVFGEIGARPPGARTVDVMNYTCDSDLYTRWAEAVVLGEFTQPVVRAYNAAAVCKRAQGQGHIRAVEGLGRLLSEFGEWVAAVDLLPIGAHRRDWRQTLLSDGWVMVRHPELTSCIEIADRFASDLQIYAG
ncbi:MAG TPA: ATP-grasp domain-containing protein [Candidatus Deferrimicrobium sp.]|nr:ATP-grasp domain-containing protein [Candidatus Deferrimicrobium sp.]